MHSLVVTRWAPWPPTSGARHRSANMIAGLSELGAVDVFLLGDPALESGIDPPEGLAIGRTGYAPRSMRPLTRLERVAGLFPGRPPEALLRQSDADVRRAFAAWQETDYDLVWFVRIESWVALHDLVDAPAVIDYDDLRDHLARSRLQSSWPDPSPTERPGSRLRAATRARRDAADIAAWHRVQRRTAREVEAVVVCSELDRARLGVPNAAIVPNGVDLHPMPAEHRRAGGPPTLCLQGSLRYRPNEDAATVLVRDVLPRVRAEVPDAEVRLVGRASARVEALGREPGVTVTGHVEHMTAELGRATVVAVPLREGAGTRIKVLEALAHRVPVVATSIAAEGLDLEHGVHLLVADDPARFAAACVTLLRDAGLRNRLADAGAARVHDRYGWDQARRATSALAADVVGSAAVG